MPSDKDFVTALRALGLDTKAAADKSSSSAKDGLKAPDTHAMVKGTMYHLQLLLRTFAAVCRYQQQVTSVLCVAEYVETRKRKDYAFQRQFNEKPSIIPGCPEAECVDAPPMSLCCPARFTTQPLLVYHAVLVDVSRASRTLQY